MLKEGAGYIPPFPRWRKQTNDARSSSHADYDFCYWDTWNPNFAYASGKQIRAQIALQIEPGITELLVYIIPMTEYNSEIFLCTP